MEGKSFSYIVGMCVGIAVAIIVLSLIRKRRGGATGEYDERQKLVRGKAFQWAFFTLLIYLVADGTLCALWRPWATPGVDNILGILLGIGTFLMVAIRGDAYFSLKENPRTFQLLCLVVIACQLPDIVMSVRSEEGFITGGCLNGNCMAVGCVVLYAAAFVALKLHESAEDGEDA